MNKVLYHNHVFLIDFSSDLLFGSNEVDNLIKRADDGSYCGMVDAISNGAIDSSMEGTNARAVEGVNKYDSDTNGCDKGSGNDGSNDCAIDSPMLVGKVYGVEGSIKNKMQSVVEAN